MKSHSSITLIAAGLLLASLGTVANAVQIDTEHTCCLAAEWFAPATAASAQSSGDFCCIASEWSANDQAGLQERAELAAQSDSGTCCIANEWNTH